MVEADQSHRPGRYSGRVTAGTESSLEGRGATLKFLGWLKLKTHWGPGKCMSSVLMGKKIVGCK